MIIFSFTILVASLSFSGDGDKIFEVYTSKDTYVEYIGRPVIQVSTRLYDRHCRYHEHRGQLDRRPELPCPHSPIIFARAAIRVQFPEVAALEYRDTQNLRSTITMTCAVRDYCRMFDCFTINVTGRMTFHVKESRGPAQYLRHRPVGGNNSATTASPVCGRPRTANTAAICIRYKTIIHHAPPTV